MCIHYIKIKQKIWEEVKLNSYNGGFQGHLCVALGHSKRGYEGLTSLQPTKPSWVQH